MSTSLMKMQALSMTPGCTVQLIKWSSGDWHFSWEAKLENSAVKLSSSRPNIDTVVDEVYAKFERLTGTLPEFAGLLPPPPPPSPEPDFQEADHMIRPDKPSHQSPLDDDIPF